MIREIVSTFHGVVTRHVLLEKAATLLGQYSLGWRKRRGGCRISIESLRSFCLGE